MLEGRKPDKIPAGFWYHYDENFTVKEMTEAHLKTYRETNVDVYKIMQDYIQKIDAVVKVPSDWKDVRFPGKSSPVFQSLLDVAKGILDATGHDAIAFQTMFGPLKTAVQTYGYDLVMEHCKQAPQLVADAVMRIAEAQTEWAAGFIEAGVDGLFYSGQFSEPGRFTKEEFDILVKPGDLMVLEAAEKAGGTNLLHICGEPDYSYKSTPAWYVEYPFAIVNWSVKDTGIGLKEGKALFGGKPVLGGMDNRGYILDGEDSQIVAAARASIESVGTMEGYMLGADCTIQGNCISNQKIAVAVETAHEYIK